MIKIQISICNYLLLINLFVTREENIAAAVSAVHQHKLNVLTASKIFGVSRTTLRRRLINPFPNKNGGQTIFTPYEEGLFVTLLCIFSGFEITVYLYVENIVPEIFKNSNTVDTGLDAIMS